MPIYRIRIRAEDDVQQEVELGFYKDSAATEYARRIACGAAAEVWRDKALVARIEARVPAEAAA